MLTGEELLAEIGRVAKTLILTKRQESELLAWFLNLKYDHIEAARSFFTEGS